ncbi:MAG: aminotransferase class III-fold pyridoxal phosphate-dependent enzyme [Mycobacteriaceae bacterium]|nr:aminotransferase class III-fold pyridoxal phosphate-dependent enzyme [Mycobacteriaceae bacterium]NBQ42965.1 aminotransferase class III-fold pyridoxal phosphate-dependent enzyme [Mycobacteriaceae bacterium]
MDPLAQLDHAHVWHPFTQMRDWLKREPIVITAGQGALLRDVHGREYLDANSSIWTNLHGHNHPKLNAALQRQLGKIAHSSALGFANEPASQLAARLVGMANGKFRMQNRDAVRAKPNSQFAIRNSQFQKVFFSDDGSTAMEVALKLAYEFTRRTRGPKTKPRFLSLAGAYHGDTVGAVSLGHIDLFHKAYGGLLFKTDQVMSPYCYRCPFNKAKPERADAREYRKCNWECVGKVEAKCAAARKRGNDYAAFVFEPRMQGAAGMIPQPAGWLKRVTDIARGHGALLVADEVMTGFGRTGGESRVERRDPRAGLPTPFASHAEGVQPEFLALAKGLTGGYLPMAATLTTQSVFDAFLGEYEEFKTFFHGHSFTGNQLGAAAALASLELLASKASVAARTRLEANLRHELNLLWALPNVGDVRQIGLAVGIELVRDWRTREPFELQERAGIRVCEAMARRGVLTRPIGSVVVLMPPYCTTAAQVKQMVGALREAVAEVLGASSAPHFG